MNKFFENDNLEVESFKNTETKEGIFFGSKKDEIPFTPENIGEIKSGEMARFVEEKKEEKKSTGELARYVDPNEEKPVIYEKPTHTITQTNYIPNTPTESKQNTIKNIINKIFKK